jgi:hypothetical protein
MPRITLGAAWLVAALALSAAAASSASAGWFVGGSELPENSKSALSTKASVTSPILFNTPALSLKISCSGFKPRGAVLDGGPAGNAEASGLDFESCSEVSPSTCKLSSSTIETEPILALSTTETSSTKGLVLSVHPKSGKVIAGILFEGSCAAAGEQPLAGSVSLNGPTLLEAQTEQAIEGMGTLEEAESLTLAGHPTFIEGTAKIKQGAGQQMQARPDITAPKPADLTVKKGVLSGNARVTFTIHTELQIETNTLAPETIFTRRTEAAEGNPTCVGFPIKVNNTCVIEYDFKPPEAVHYSSIFQMTYKRTGAGQPIRGAVGPVVGGLGKP